MARGGRHIGRTGPATALTVTAALIAAAAAGPCAAAAGGPRVTTAAQVKAGTLAEPTPEEQEHLREVAGAIWPPELAAGWNMNADVADVLSTATGEILKCSEAFALVPRPPGFLPGMGYLVGYWKNLRDYFLVVKENRTYRACVVTAAANYRSPIEIASMGI
ncbi:hypothetical protein AQI88_17495 [Streptomyces cellostaticus]|uniref:Uncharacterized protein n=1 Tax=Streptomyces cellostaticus TaxID=67285 RepID=A0A101NM38_9ACTN|nr:hypothetical protein [Streptomyces cellostaticus]KUM95416.1 hypothetical protein AQI88_17495 [Streptomyces cellostaticus]GHI01969.1 hypothetical protein Scel_02900 [Streptomyces cellostaticus]